VLPLFALPFAVTLDKIGGVIYRTIYGVLVFLSLLTMWGFLYQPQWMYNQPVVSGALNGKSELLTKAFPTLATVFEMPFLREIDLTGLFPSFVSPYFAYYMGAEYGDAAAAEAWRASWLPLAIIALIVFVSLLLARGAFRAQPQGGEPPAGGSTVDLTTASQEGVPTQFDPALLPTQNPAALHEGTLPQSSGQARTHPGLQPSFLARAPLIWVKWAWCKTPGGLLARPDRF
jgi:hypothetical protein